MFWKISFNRVLLFVIFSLLFIIAKRLIYCESIGSAKKSPDSQVELDPDERDYQKSLLITKNVSKILDKLLKGYDKRLRPNYAGPSVVVGITININNINSVSEVNMEYTLDLYFRQIWVDKRLSFDGVDELVIGSDMLHKIWLPDTYIANDRKTYFHKATVQNKFIRINPDGQILYSMRMTVTAACPMNFRDFPMDHQECDLELESYGFRMEDIRYKWAEGLNKSALDVAPNIELPQLIYRDFKLIERQFRLSTGLYSRLTMRLYFVRSLGYYITQIYIPSTLIVMLSWVSFWLDRTAAPARVSLGITTVLTMVTFIWSTNASLPKISYIKGIDVYLVTCFVMTFCSVIEYGMVSFVHRQNEKRKKIAQEHQQHQQQPLRELKNQNPTSQVVKILQQPKHLEINSLKHTQNALPIKQKSLILLHEFHDKNSPLSESEINQSNNLSNSYTAIRRQTQDGSPILWEKKQNSFDDLENSILPIHVEKPKSCTCNLQQYSTRKLETNSNLNMALNVTKSHQINNNCNTSRNFQCQCQKCKTIASPKQNRYSAFFDPKIQNDMNESIEISNKSGHAAFNNLSPMTQPLLNTYVTKLPPNGCAITDIKKQAKKRYIRTKIKASTIDNYSRGIFPFVFYTFHIFYWTYYLKIVHIK